MVYDFEVNVDLIEERLFENRHTIGPRYGVKEPVDTPHGFADQLIEAMEQPSVSDPLAHSWTPQQVFHAAVRSLGSNQTDWAKYMSSERALRATLLDFEPALVAAGLADEPPTLTVGDIERHLHGQYRRSTATRIAAWAKRLADEPGFYGSVQRLAEAIKIRGEIEDDHEVFPPLALALAGFVTGFGQRDLVAVGAPARHPQGWKLPGMEFPLVSEFLRNLGWDGFKPDTHVRRLFQQWLGDRLHDFDERAAELTAIIGSRSRTAQEIVCYSLAGVAVTPDGQPASRIDNLVWLVGANVETARVSAGTSYLRARG